MGHRILISGWYGNNNVGDETILAGMLESISACVPDSEFLVFSDDPDWTTQIYGVDSFHQWPRNVSRSLSALLRPSFWIYVCALVRQLKTADVFVLGGGGLLQHSNFGVIPFWLGKLLLAQLLHKPTMMYAIGVGTVDRVLDKMLIKWIAGRTSIITVRDQGSEKLLKSFYGLKCPNIQYTADPALALNPSRVGAQQVKRGRIGIVLLPLWSVGIRERGRQERFNEIIVKAIDSLIEDSQSEICLLVENYREDLDVVELVYRGLRHRQTVSIVKKKFTVAENLAFISGLQVLVSMRLHPLISASLVRTPFVGVVAHAKVREFLNQVGQEDMGIGYDVINPDMIHAKIQRAVENRRAIIQSLEVAVSHLRAEAIRNAELLHQLTSKHPSHSDDSVGHGARIGHRL